MATIEKMQAATERDHAIARNIVSQVNAMTLMASGFTSYVAVPNGAEIDFRLARAYGHRTVEVTLNKWDMYDVTVYRFGRNMKKHLVIEYTMVFADQLDQLIYDGINKSCER